MPTVPARGRASFSSAFTFPGVELSAFPVEVRKEGLGRIEGANVLSLLVFLLALGDAAVDRPALGRRVFVVIRRQFRKDGDHTPGCPELNFLPALKTGLPRTAKGTTSGVLLLFFTATVMVGNTIFDGTSFVPATLP
jgi:hypothetical protein